MDANTHYYKEFPRVVFHKVNMLKDSKSLSIVQNAALVLLDTQHLPKTSPFEYEFFAKINGKFKGVRLGWSLGVAGQLGLDPDGQGSEGRPTKSDQQ